MTKFTLKLCKMKQNFLLNPDKIMMFCKLPGTEVNYPVKLKMTDEDDYF